MTMNAGQTVTPKTPQQLERANQIVASFRDVLAKHSTPKSQHQEMVVEINKGKVELFRKYQTSNYGVRHA